MTQHHTNTTRDLTTTLDHTTTPPTITTTNPYYAHTLLHWLQADPTTNTNTTGITTRT